MTDTHSQTAAALSYEVRPLADKKRHWLSLQQLEVTCAGFGISGALLLAINVPYSSVGWLLMMISSAFGLPWAMRMRFTYMLMMQTVFLLINGIGVWRNLLPLL